MNESLSGFGSEITTQQVQFYEVFGQAMGRCMNWAQATGGFNLINFEDYSTAKKHFRGNDASYLFQAHSPSALVKRNMFGLTQADEVSGALFVSLLYLSHSFRAVQGIFTDERSFSEVPLPDDPKKLTTAFKEAQIPQGQIDMYGVNGLVLGRKMLFKTLVPDGDSEKAFGEIGGGDEFIATKIPGVNWNMYIVDGKREHAIRVEKGSQFQQ